MAKYRVKLFYMHEHEKEAAKTAEAAADITDAEWTDGYVMGVVDESKIPELTAKGLVVSLVEKVASPQEATTMTIGAAAPPIGASFASVSRESTEREIMTRPLPIANEDNAPADKIISQDSRRTTFYVVRFNGPITQERRKELSKLKIKLLERVTRNKYTVQLKPSEVKSLAEVSFVDWIRLYDEADTLRTRDAAETLKPAIDPGDESRPRTASTRAEAEPSKSPRTAVFSIRTHQSKDMPTVVKWLASKNRKPIWKRGDRMQVALEDKSKVLLDLVARPEVAVVEECEPPRLSDSFAREILGLIRKKEKLGLEGAGEIIGIADTGIDQTHPDFKNRIVGVKALGRKNDSSDPEGHGTHVAGCVLGDGSASNGEVVGAAPKAKLFFQSILDANGELGGLPHDLQELFAEAYAAGARIHNNSWGAFSFARYAERSLDVDRFVADHPDMLVVIAAGNDGIGIPRAAGAVMNSTKGFVDWPTVAAPATAKNGLTVGASRSSRKEGGYANLTWGDAWPNKFPDKPIALDKISSKDQCLAAFSSRGPCDDLRIKPDVVAPGTDIAAAKSKDAPLHKFWGAYPGSDKYGFMGGTSMAAPYVAGCAALVREWYRTKGGWQTPSAALIKATLINGAQRLTGIDAEAPLPGDPNYHQGFGRIDMASTVPNPLNPKLQLHFVDTWKNPAMLLKQTGQTLRFKLKVGKTQPLRICLVWTDPAARGLQNSLVLLVDDGGANKFVGNAKAANILNIAGATRDPNNNVQVVRIDKPKAGDYSIVITAGNLLFPPQSFALVATGDLQSNLVPF